MRRRLGCVLIPLLELFSRRARACRRFVELFRHPVLQSSDVLRTAQEILYQVICRHGAAGFQDHAAIAHGCVSGKQVLMIELQEEIFGDNFIPKISVVSGGVAAEMAEGGPGVSFGQGSEQGVFAASRRG